MTEFWSEKEVAHRLGLSWWWAVQDLNLWPPVCKTDALPLS